jgi:NADH-quinone oxidoreductase subunit N
MAAVPLHFYAADVYQGAATPVTAFMAFVPKTTGFVALIKLLEAYGATTWAAPETLVKLVCILAALTMSVGNVLGLLQYNVKRVFAYSSVAHTGYMLVGIAAMMSTSDPAVKSAALQGVLFYLAAYGLMNAGTFGILLLLPSREKTPATSAETYEELAGQGRQHKVLGLAMAVGCFSLTGLPLTIGFFGKAYLIFPAISAGLMPLVIVLVINAAISAAYYLRIVATMFLRDLPGNVEVDDQPALRSRPIRFAVAVSVLGTLALGIIWPLTQGLSDSAAASAGQESTAVPAIRAEVSVNPSTDAVAKAQ